MPRNKAPDITVSIVSFNTRELLRTCLQSLQARRDEGEVALQIIMADNGSTDGSIEMVRHEFPEVEVFSTGGNIGYGRANNLAFQRARGHYFCVLNSDAEVELGALSTMRDFMDTHPRTGAVGPQLLWPDGNPQTSYGSDPQWIGVLYEQIFLNNLLSRLPGRKTSNEPSAEPREVEQLNGACLFMHTAAYGQISGFDPAYFMYVEDVDLNVRLRQAGWKIYFLPQARVRHHLGASSERDWRTRARMVASYNWSRYYYFSRQGHALRLPLLKAMMVLGAGLRLLGWTFLALAQPRAHEKISLFRQVLRQTWRMKVKQK